MIDPVVFLLYLYTWVIILRAVLSWLRTDPRNPAIKLLHILTEPVLKPLRAVAPPSNLGGIDISPILAIILIQIVRYLLQAAAR